MSSVLSVNNVRKKYRIFKHPSDRVKEALHPLGKSFHTDFWALNTVSFELQAGQSLGIIGCNGSGKSTLLELVAGISAPTEGTITTNVRISALLELGAGFNPEFSGRDNALLYGAIIGCSETEMKGKLDEIEKFADIGEFFDLPVKTYSSGMYARLAFSTAISVEADILIVDEILGVGDAKFQEKCFHKLQSLKDAGVSFILVSHNAEQILKSCDKALYLEQGSVNYIGDPIEAVARYHEALFSQPSKNESRNDNSISRSSDYQTDGLTLPNAASRLLERDSCCYKEMLCYNKDERRIVGSGAEILDFIVLANDDADFFTLTGTEKLSIFYKVIFYEDIESPSFGICLTSSDGFMLSGTNTILTGKKLSNASKGDIRFFKVEFDINLNAGDYFLDIGIDQLLEAETVMIDVRRAVVHLNVGRDSHCTGFFYSDFKLDDLMEEQTEKL